MLSVFHGKKKQRMLMIIKPPKRFASIQQFSIIEVLPM